MYSHDRTPRISGCHKHGIVVLSLVLALSCVSPRYNQELPPDVDGSVSTGDPYVSTDDPSLLMFVALSGGGTRAATMSWETLKYLKSVPYAFIAADGTTVRSNLADQIDYISGISGGSFAAAAWLLYRDRMEDFDRVFIERNVQCDIIRQIFLSADLFKLPSPYYNRINVASEYYDEKIFMKKTFADLSSHPVLWINSTHLALGLRFTYTDPYFRMLNSDIRSYPVGYACAASSAFPVLLDPMTLKNYGTELGDEELLKNMKYRVALENSRENIENDYYCKTVRFFNCKKNLWHHMADGGIVDNQGLQAILDEFRTNGIINKAVNNRQMRRLVIINVNAGTDHSDKSCEKQCPPGVTQVMMYTMTISMDRLSAKRWMEIKNNCHDLSQSILAGLRDMDKPYCIEVSFRNVSDSSKREKCLNLPTSFSLKPDEIRLIREVTPDLVKQDPDMERLVSAIR